MKVLLFSVTTGEGHNTTAKAIARALEERGAEVKILDTYRLSGKFMYHLIDKGYLLITSHLKLGYGVAYWFEEHRRGNSYRRSLSRWMGRRLARRFKREIDAFAPDVIVSTHSFASKILDITKQRHGIDAKLAGIVTDFTMHPFWEEALRFDRVILPCEPLIPLAVKKGFREEQIAPTGIPINPRFANTTPKAEARAQLGIYLDRPTLMIMSGSMGYGNIVKTLKKLDASADNFQMIVVCGNNKKMYEKIQKATWHKPLLSFGFTDKIPLLMDASDAIITKPGGLTTSEALSRRLPMIIRNPIPGHEVRNVRFLTGAGAAMTTSRHLSLTEAVEKILSEETRTEMLAAIDKIRKPDAVRNLCDEIVSLATPTDKA